MKKIVCIMLCFVASLYGQDKLSKPLLERMIEPRISLDSSYLSDADVDGGGGVSVLKNRVRINNKIAGISYTNWKFDWRDIDDLSFGNTKDAPMKEMHSFRLHVNLPYMLDEKWFLLAQISANSTYEKQTNDSYSGGVFAFASYKMDSDHTFQFGAFANYHPIKSLALPVMSYSYRSQQRDGLQVVFGFPRTYIGYHLDDGMLVRFGALFSQSVIKLSHNSVLESNGYVEAKDYMCSLGISYEFDGSLHLESDLLYSLKREFNIYDSSGEIGTQHTINPSLGANLKIVYHF